MRWPLPFATPLTGNDSDRCEGRGWPLQFATLPAETVLVPSASCLVFCRTPCSGGRRWHAAMGAPQTLRVAGIVACVQSKPLPMLLSSMNTSRMCIEKQRQPQFAVAEDNDFLGPNSVAGALTMQQKVQLSGGTRAAHRPGGPLGALTELGMAAARVGVQLLLVTLQWPC